jgi:transposase
MQLHEMPSQPKVFIGMDIHKKSWSVSIQTDLFFHKSFTMPPDASELAGYIERHFDRHEVFLTYEAGCCGFSAARYFLNLGWMVLVINPADIRKSDKDLYMKTDKCDARLLSNQLKMGALKGIYIPGEEQEQLTSLARHRSQLTRKLRQAKSHIKSMLLFHGIKVPDQYDNSNWSAAFLEWLKEVQFSSATGNYSLKAKIRMYEFVKHEYLETANELRAYCRKHFKTDYYLLKSIPGIGGFLAAVILAECGDLRRFNTEGQFASFIGIVPGIHASGDTERSLGITPRCRSQLRSYLIEAAWVAVRKDPEMQAYYRKHFGKNPKSIIVKVAHKMTRRILSVIKNQRPYQVNVQLN